MSGGSQLYGHKVTYEQVRPQRDVLQESKVDQAKIPVGEEDSGRDSEILSPVQLHLLLECADVLIRYES